MGKIVIEGQKMTLEYSSPRCYWSIVHDVLTGSCAARLVDRLSVVNCRVVGALVSCQNVLPQREILEITGTTGRGK